jgi:hypothetical protein
MKIRLSCQRCYIYKRKCDQMKPSCSGCRKVHGQSCDYNSALLASARIPNRVLKKRKIHLVDASPLPEAEHLPSPTESFGENAWGSATDMSAFWNEPPSINTDLVSPREGALLPKISPNMFLSYVWETEIHPSPESSCVRTPRSIGSSCVFGW